MLECLCGLGAWTAALATVLFGFIDSLLVSWRIGMFASVSVSATCSTYYRTYVCLYLSICGCVCACVCVACVRLLMCAWCLA